jgi:hypothetical protein
MCSPAGVATLGAERTGSIALGLCHVRRDRPRAQHGDADRAALDAQLVAQRLGERHHADLAHGVRSDERDPAPETRDRGRVDDVRGRALRAQDRQEGLHPVHDAPEIHADHPAPVVERLVREQVEGRDAGVVADDVDPAETVERRAAEPRDRVRVRDVGRDDERLDARRAQRRVDARERVGLDVGEHDAAALRAERRRERRADPAAGAGHDRDVTALKHLLAHPFPSLRRIGSSTTTGITRPDAAVARCW